MGEWTPLLIENYRPITVLSAVDKVFKQLIAKLINSRRFDNGLEKCITAYCKTHSWETALINLIEHWKLAKGNKQSVQSMCSFFTQQETYHILNCQFSCDVIIFQNKKLPILLLASSDVSIFQNKKLPILLLTSSDVRSYLLITWCFAMFKPDRVPHYVREHVWISKFMCCVTLKWRQAR